jgi:hypothetical protein
MTATVIPLRATLWLGYLSNKELLDRFGAALDAQDEAACDCFHDEIKRREEAGTLGEEDWYL